MRREGWFHCGYGRMGRPILKDGPSLYFKAFEMCDLWEAYSHTAAVNALGEYL